MSKNTKYLRKIDRDFFKERERIAKIFDQVEFYPYSDWYDDMKLSKSK